MNFGNAGHRFGIETAVAQNRGVCRSVRSPACRHREEMPDSRVAQARRHSGDVDLDVGRAWALSLRLTMRLGASAAPARKMTGVSSANE